MPRTRTFDTDLHFTLRGEAGPPVLLVMGMGTGGEAWAGVADDLARDHRVLTFDHAGLGGSGPEPGARDLSVHARRVAALLDHVGWDEAHVVGQSMGGMIAQHLALGHPDRVRSLGLLVTTADGAAAMRSTVPENVAELPALILDSPDKRTERMIRLLHGPRAIREVGAEELARRLSAGHQRGPSLTTLLAQRRAIAAHDTRLQLWRLADTPTLVLGATHDRVIHPDHSRFLATALPHARFVMREEAGHALHREHPDEVAAELRQLFSDAA